MRYFIINNLGLFVTLERHSRFAPFLLRCFSLTMAENSGCASTPAAKRKKQGARYSDRQLDMLIDYMFSNRVLVRAATESTLTTAERTALWDVITGRLNAEGPAWKERVEWKNLWNARVCSARKHDGLLAVEAARTGGGANPSLPSSSEASPPLPAELLYQEEGLGTPPEVPLQPASQPAPSGGGQPAADCGEEELTPLLTGDTCIQ
ncbi:hypothetical protein ISCGN_013105 [Ixodes scapularis]